MLTHQLGELLQQWRPPLLLPSTLDEGEVGPGKQAE
jgi:hypothetical protein